MDKILDSINLPIDIKKLDIEQLDSLSSEIREFLVDHVSKTGGHLASNLGVVELTLALHYIFDTPSDKLIWDVGHQSYVHKIITGRKDKFDTIRKLDGLSGFPKNRESEYDAFDTGHSSTSISAALGIARARDLNNENYSVAAVIGDGALTGGMAFEALNDAGQSHCNLIVILNDNQMSISKNVGGMSRYLSKIRTEPFYFKVKEDIDIILNKIPAIGKSAIKALDRVKGSIKYMIMPGIIFEELGFKYLGPIDGHDFSELISVLSRAKNIRGGPVLVHICTQKGRGYSHAEENPHVFHGISPFEIETGETLSGSGLSYSEVFGHELVEIAGENQKVVAITAAMRHGTGLNYFADKYPQRFFDVGIAEQHGVTLAAGLAKGGLKPVFAVYSSFLQRAYDQIIHDVALQNLNVVFAIDRAGVVGEDGETHQGIYDLSYLRHIPGITIVSPADYEELRMFLRYAVTKHTGPIAIRYPRGREKLKLEVYDEIELGKGVLLKEGKDLTIITIGNMFSLAIRLQEILKDKGIFADVINARFIKPLDEKLIIKSIEKTRKVITLEDNITMGGFGSGILELVTSLGIKVDFKSFGFPDEPIEQGRIDEILIKYGLDEQAIISQILELLRRE